MVVLSPLSQPEMNTLTKNTKQKKHMAIARRVISACFANKEGNGAC